MFALRSALFTRTFPALGATARPSNTECVTLERSSMRTLHKGNVTDIIDVFFRYFL